MPKGQQRMQITRPHVESLGSRRNCGVYKLPRRFQCGTKSTDSCLRFLPCPHPTARIRVTERCPVQTGRPYSPGRRVRTGLPKKRASLKPRTPNRSIKQALMCMLLIPGDGSGQSLAHHAHTSEPRLHCPLSGSSMALATAGPGKPRTRCPHNLGIPGLTTVAH